MSREYKANADFYIFAGGFTWEDPSIQPESTSEVA